MFADVANFRPRPPATGAPPDLSVLLSQVLLAFTLDFERESALSLPICINALHVLTERGVPVRDLPQLTGVSKEALSMAVGILARRSCAVTGQDPAASRGKLVRLTPGGLAAQGDYLRLLDAVERRWRAAKPYLRQTTAVLRDPHGALPRYPMVLHRGGWPDGS
jgi:DNA-binding MarR family transcriptional regulator